MRKVFKKDVMIFALVFILSVIFGIPASADVYIGMNAPHGDMTNYNEGVSTYSPVYLAQYYPHGSYYSVNRQACTCHGTTICCNENYSCNCGKYNYYINGYDTSKGVGTSYQCAGFAKMCYYQYNEMDVPHLPDYSSNRQYYTLSVANLYSALNSIGTQAYVRGKTKGGSDHSIFIVGFTSSTVTIWQANYGGRCLITNQTLSYSDFLNCMSSVNWYYTSDGDYVDSEVDYICPN